MLVNELLSQNMQNFIQYAYVHLFGIFIFLLYFYFSYDLHFCKSRDFAFLHRNLIYQLLDKLSRMHI